MGYLAAKAKHRASGVSSSTPLRRNQYCTQMPDTGRYQQGYIVRIARVRGRLGFSYSPDTRSLRHRKHHG